MVEILSGNSYNTEGGRSFKYLGIKWGSSSTYYSDLEELK